MISVGLYQSTFGNIQMPQIQPIIVLSNLMFGLKRKTMMLLLKQKLMILQDNPNGNGIMRLNQ